MSTFAMLRKRYLRECLIPPWLNSRTSEIIYINDGSTDSSPDIIREVHKPRPRVKMIDRKAPSLNYGDSMNRGLEMARGEYVGVLDPATLCLRIRSKNLVAKADAEHADVVKATLSAIGPPSRRRELFGDVGEYMTSSRIAPVDRPGIFYRKPSIW
ncbi:MAG: glycosyltransferase family 2 protein [Collinsella sp.]